MVKRVCYEPNPVTLTHVVGAFCLASGLTEADLYGKFGDLHCQRVRHHAFFGARVWTDHSLQEIGAAFNRTHTPVLAGISDACKTIYADVSPMGEALRQAGVENKYLSPRRRIISGLFNEGYKGLLAVAMGDVAGDVLLRLDPVKNPFNRLFDQKLVKIHVNPEASEPRDRAVVSVQRNAFLALGR